MIRKGTKFVPAGVVGPFVSVTAQRSLSCAGAFVPKMPRLTYRMSPISPLL